MEALDERGIPFRIRNLTILDQPVVRDMLAYLRLIARPADNVACARVLAAPAWGLEPADLVRLCERAGKKRGTLWDALEPAQGELPFSGAGEAAALKCGCCRRGSVPCATGRAAPRPRNFLTR